MDGFTEIFYTDYCDFPRVFAVNHGAHTFLFDAGFDEAADGYPNEFTIFARPRLSDSDLRRFWEHIDVPGSVTLGAIPATAVRFSGERLHWYVANSVIEEAARGDQHSRRPRIAACPSRCRRSVPPDAILNPMAPHDLLNKLHDEPFKPFRVRLSNNNTIDVLDAGSVVVGPTSAIMPLEYVEDERGVKLVLRWKTVALSHMVEFVDIDTKPNGSKRRRK